MCSINQCYTCSYEATGVTLGSTVAMCWTFCTSVESWHRMVHLLLPDHDLGKFVGFNARCAEASDRIWTCASENISHGDYSRNMNLPANRIGKPSQTSVPPTPSAYHMHSTAFTPTTFWSKGFATRPSVHHHVTWYLQCNESETTSLARRTPYMSHRMCRTAQAGVSQDCR
jgi:hypothetical protein